MNKELYLERVKKFNVRRSTKAVFRKQIEMFYNYNSYTKNKYKIGDKVILNKNNLIHGSRADLKDLKIISKIGLISSEFYKEFDKKKKKPYILEVWDIKEKISLEDWIKKYAGVTIKIRDGFGNPFKYIISPFDDIIKNIQKESDYLDYVIVQNQEQRFVPNDIYIRDQKLAFILEYKESDQLVKNDLFNSDFDKKITKDILPKWFYQKYFIKDNFDEYQTDRQKAIIFGLPACMIKGIFVSRKLEKDTTYLKKLKKIFPDCYISNIDGIIIL